MDRVLGTQVSPSLDILPPRLYGIDVAADIADRQRAAWNGGHWPERPIRLLEIEDALVMARGLTFRTDGTVVEATTPLIPRDVVAKAKAEFAKHFANAHRLDQDALLCIRPGHTCYGHAITELMGAAWVGASLAQERSFSLLISAPPGLVEAYTEAARHAGLGARSIFNWYDTAPLRVPKLYVVDGFAVTETYISPLIARFAETVRRKCGAPESASRRLYVERGTESARTIANGDELWRYLSCRGFEKVRPESLAWREQVCLFSEATHVLGAMGSGLANAVFCLPGAKLLTLAPAGMLDTFFWRIAACVGLEYDEFRCVDVSNAKYEATKRYLDRNIVVDMALISKWLNA